jgi:hypothetical protein
MSFVADFETTTDPKDCRVWAYAICDIENPENVNIGINIDSFMNWCNWKGNNDTVFFHNLKFDGGFIIDWLLKHGFKHVENPEERESNTFTTLISDKGLFYQIEVIFWKQGKKIKKITFQDSLKLLPMPVEKIAKAFNLEISKLEIDYKAYRPKGHLLTKEEIEYIKNDVKIVAFALNYLFNEGMTKMTTASNALAEFKSVITPKNFDRWFPMPYYDEDVRQSYRGGFTYLNPKYKEKDVGAGIVLDVNSLYPSVMYFEKLPFGEPIFYEGKYEPDPLYDIYIQMITCQFKVKDGHIPTIQIKHSAFFSPTDYIEDSQDLEVTMCLTSVDLELFLDHYDVYNLEYHSGWKFKSASGMFKSYIDKWSANKIKAKEEGNGGLYTLSKLMLNSLYGKFATAPRIRGQIPYLDEASGVVKYRYSEYSEKDPIYVPIASFITSYARNKTIRSAQKVYDRFIYADTDSLHLEGLEIPDNLDIHPTNLGAWDHETTFCRARFLRQKSYVEDLNPPETWGTDEYDKSKFKITCAGMPKACHKYVNFDNFKIGNSFTGKLQPKRVNGGVVLMDVDFTLKL